MATTFNIYQVYTLLYALNPAFLGPSFFIEKLNAEDVTARLRTGKIFEFHAKPKFDTREQKQPCLAKCWLASISRFFIITDAKSGAPVLDLGMLAKQDHLTNYPPKSGLNHIQQNYNLTQICL